MKAKFNLGFLTGYMNVPNAWPKNQVHIPILETSKVVFGDLQLNPPAQNPIKTLVFECTHLDEDKCAVYELLEVA